ncbi:MAG: hypothetical protein V4719_21650 [Planctomycetota bacterium]
MPGTFYFPRRYLGAKQCFRDTYNYVVQPPIGWGGPVHHLLSIALFRASWNFSDKTDASQAAAKSTSSQSHTEIHCRVPLLQQTGVITEPLLND